MAATKTIFNYINFNLEPFYVKIKHFQFKPIKIILFDSINQLINIITTKLDKINLTEKLL